jgi:hypothetical protein
MANFFLRQGDTLPRIKATLKDATGATINLGGGALVRFRMRAQRGGALKVDQPATITDAAAGQVEYAWQAADTDTAGDYLAEWRVTFGSDRQTHPNSTFVEVSITAGL